MQYRFGRLLVSSQKGNHTTPIKKLKLPIRYPGNTPITVVSVMPGYRGTGTGVTLFISCTDKIVLFGIVTVLIRTAC